jgi:hypothetical protein
MKASRLLIQVALWTGILLDLIAVLLLALWLFAPSDRHGNFFLLLVAGPIAVFGFALTTVGLVGLIRSHSQKVSGPLSDIA